MATSPDIPQPPPTPWPLPPDVRDVLWMGGTFDPPHVSHTRLADALRQRVAPHAGLVFVPAALSPFKHDRPTPAAHRVAMLHLAVRGLPRAGVWTDEIDRDDGSPSFTIDSVRRALIAAPGVRPRLVIGSDQAVSFHRWREAPALLTFAPPLILLREPIADAPSLLSAIQGTGAWNADQMQAWARAIVPAIPEHPANSTAIRAELRAGREPPADWLAPGVLEYIRANRLYTPPAGG